MCHRKCLIFGRECDAGRQWPTIASRKFMAVVLEMATLFLRKTLYYSADQNIYKLMVVGVRSVNLDFIVLY